MRRGPFGLVRRRDSSKRGAPEFVLKTSTCPNGSCLPRKITHCMGGGRLGMSVVEE